MDSAKNLSGEGTRIESLKNDPDSNRICIQDDIAIELAKISSKLQTVFGNSPRDIEFAIDEHDKIYLLQARPITSLQSWTNHELSHEFDTAIVSHHDINTKGNVGEVFPGATTTLTQSWCARILDLAIQTNRVKTWKRPYNKFSESVVRISHHHVLLNYLDLMLEVVDSRTVTVPMKALDYSVFGHLVTNTDALEKAIERKGGMDGIFTIMKAQIVALKNIFFIRRLMKQPNFDSKFNNPLNIKTNGDSSQIYEEITKASVNVSEMWKLHSAITEASTTLQLITFLVLSESVVNLDFSNELLLDATTILKTNSDNVISGDCPSDLNKLCKAIVKEHKIDDCFSSLSLQDAEAWIMSKQPTANLYSQFLTKFGDRCVREFDLISKPWKEDRKPLISTLQAMLKTENSTKSEEDVNPSKVVKNNISNIDTALDHISRKIKPVTRGILKLILPYTHGSTALREKAKSLGIKQVHEVRLAYRNLAMTMANEGRLPDPELILHMSHFEIHKLILYRSPCIIQKACRRRRLRSSEWENLRFPEIIHGIPVPCSDDQEISDAKDNKGISLKGTPASGGKYKGTGRVVTKLEDAKYIEKGDILITISTDIGWSPYFPLLGGVVTELGGLISHGAVVAREYGLPCIVGVELATSVIRSGEIVLIDGFKGIITQEDNKFSS
jgi:phosphohistidine swiveling domain-containing protein